MISFSSKIIALALTLLLDKTIAHEVNCVNDDDFEFYYDGRNRSCKDIRLDEARRQATCVDDAVSAACPQSCGKCCEDLPKSHYTFIKNSEKEASCAWLGQKQARKDRYCHVEFEGRTIQDACPLACDFCFNEITVSPSASPTEPPTGNPTVSQTPTKMHSTAPSHMPTYSPSSTPTVKCTNDPDYDFVLENVGTKRKCDWIKKNPTKIGIRQDNYCGTSQFGHVIGDICCAACAL